MRPASRDHHVVDRGRQVPEEPLEGRRIRGVEGRSAERAELARGALQALGSRPVRITLAPSARASSGRFEPDAGAAADHDDGLPEQFRLARVGQTSYACAGRAPSMWRVASLAASSGVLPRSRATM